MPRLFMFKLFQLNFSRFSSVNAYLRAGHLSCAVLLAVSLHAFALEQPSTPSSVSTPAPVSTPTLGASNQPVAAIPAAPQLAATGYILIDADTGEVLADNNADERLPPASLTKMMSSYLVVDEIEKGRISEGTLVNISVKAWKMGGSRIYCAV
jgi:serine-type D-Ala-D-Ala carboxypeptidase (penicillin-binding protein 5/6)